MKKITLSLFILSLFSCFSLFDSDNITEFNPENGYLGVYLKGNYYIKFLNLDTNEIIDINIKESDDLTITTLPVGEYAIEYMRFGNKISGYPMPVPLSLKTIVKVESNRLLFLGKIKTDVTYGFDVTYYKVSHEYPMNKAIFDIESNYYYDDDFEVTQLEQLTLENY